jgi:hypothetical protein
VVEITAPCGRPEGVNFPVVLDTPQRSLETTEQLCGAGAATAEIAGGTAIHPVQNAGPSVGINSCEILSKPIVLVPVPALY